LLEIFSKAFASLLDPTMLTNLANSFNPSFQSSDYWIIQNSARAARPDLGLQEGEAARLALEALEKLKGSAAHRLSLIPVVHSLPELQSLFLNLDKYLFREVLKNNVSFRFSSDLHPKIHGSTSALGAFGDQIVVSLNSDLTSHPSHLALVASLIHQMAHAYLLVCCGFGASNADDERHDLKHGLAFSSIVHYIQDLLVDDAMIPLPDLFYCSDVLDRSTHLPRYHLGRQSLHSYCHFNLSDHEDKVACGAYMRHVKAAAKASSSDSSEKDLLPANISESTNTLGDLVNR
jgi:SprT-like family